MHKTMIDNIIQPKSFLIELIESKVRQGYPHMGIKNQILRNDNLFTKVYGCLYPYGTSKTF